MYIKKYNQSAMYKSFVRCNQLNVSEIKIIKDFNTIRI